MEEKRAPKVFTVGDIHGADKALEQCLERCGFINEIDTLISLGDIVDGWSESYECVERLLKIKNLIKIRGNHDDWFLDYLKGFEHGSGWKQGADATYDSYMKHRHNQQLNYLQRGDIPELHKKFFEEQADVFIEPQRNYVFVHGGFNRHYPIEEQMGYIMFWDRDLWSQALSFHTMEKGVINTDPKFTNKNNFDTIFIGHTSTQFWRSNEPMNAANVWNLDTGAGWAGKLTIMDIDTKEYWQSDKVMDLYPNEKGRFKK